MIASVHCQSIPVVSEDASQLGLSLKSSLALKAAQRIALQHCLP